MPGPPPKDDANRRRRNAPVHPWLDASGVGWQHGDVPEPPPGLLDTSRAAWATWFGAWFAAFWTPADLPALHVLARLYDQVQRGEFHRAAELRLWSDAYGLTPKGQQQRRWRRSTSDVPPQRSTAGRYRRLRAVEPPPGGGS